MRLCLFFVVVLALASDNGQSQSYKTIYQKIQQEPDYSGFNDLVRSNRVAKLNLHYEPLTVFVPANQAFDKYEGDTYADLAFYHMSFDVKTLKQLRSTTSLSSVNLDNPPLWITEVSPDIYVNNAKILQDQSNYVSMSRSDSRGEQQVLHMIDEVLDPMIKSPQFSHNAYDFLTTTHKWELGGAKTISKFFQRVQENKLLDLFKKREPQTIFIPVDSGIDTHKYKMINRNVILRHVVTGHVLFTRPAENSVVTMSDYEFSYSLSLQKTEDGRLFVHLVPDDNDENGLEELSSEIILPNIPVRNGVIHLISQPLGVFRKVLKPFPYLPIVEKITNDPEIDVFYKLGSITKFNQIFEKENLSFTYFVPRNNAWFKTLKLGLEPVENDHDILARHLVVSQSPYSMEQLALMTRANNYTDIELNTEGGKLKLAVFRMEESYYIRWNNKYINVVRPDYECTNGVVHILNGPLVHFKKREEVTANNNNSQSVSKLWKIVCELLAE